MWIRVLGSAAGGGVPQWNCGCAVCREARAGSGRVRPRKQDSLAITDGGERWALCNASPDVRLQIESFAPLRPRGPSRGSPIEAIVLTNGDLDHCLGLFSLRESQPLYVYATASVWLGLTRHNAFYRTLERFPGQIVWRELALGAPVALLDTMSVMAIPVPGRLPIHLRDVVTPAPMDNVAVIIRDRRGRLLTYAPSVGSIETLVPCAGVDCLFLDGTFWSSDELTGVLGVRAEELGHLPIGGRGGTLERTAQLSAARRIYTHINNTNPVLLEDSPERREVEQRGWEIASDGLEVTL
jgi:pyrroloquinoline quinone biosynthesis protein B